MKFILLLFVSVLSKLYLPLLPTEKHLRSEKHLPSVPISNNSNIAYTVQVSIGTPGQIFNLLLDTTTSNLWIVDDICKSCNKPSNVFVPTESSTFSPKIDFIHLDPQYSEAEALLCTDVVELSEFTANDQTFALVVEDLSYEGEYWDGVLGLGFNNSYDNLVQSLYNQSQIEAPMFSLYFSKNGDTDSKLILGGIDHNLIEEETMEILSLVEDQGNWVVYLDEVNFVSESINTDTQAVFDISTPFILVPQSDLYRIHDIFKYKHNCQDGPQITCSCENIEGYPNVSFLMGGSSILLPPAGYLQYNSSIGECVLLFEESEDENWVIGNSFLKQFYSVFSLPVDGNSAFIGLAVPKEYHHASHGSNSTDDLLGLKIGLPIGGVIALGAVGVLCCCLIKRRKAKNAKKNQENQQKLIIYVAPGQSSEGMQEESRLVVKADGAHREVSPIVVVNEPDKNIQTVFYPFLPPVSDS